MEAMDKFNRQAVNYRKVIAWALFGLALTEALRPQGESGAAGAGAQPDRA